MNSDVIVVGGGIGGLTSAALLAKSGQKVAVFEASREWGGCAGKFQRGNYLFPVGATLGMGFEKNGIHDRVFTYLGKTVEHHLLTKVMTIHQIHRSIDYYQHRETHLKELKVQFPMHQKEIEAFYLEIRRVTENMKTLYKSLPALPINHIDDILFLLKNFSPKTLLLLPYLHQTVHSMLKKHHLDQVDDFVHYIDGILMDSMQTDSKECVFLLGALALDIYHQGAYYLEGGLYRIAETLVESIQENKGEGFLGRTITSIKRIKDTNGKEIWSVSDHRGNEYHANHIVWNGHLENLVKILDPKEKTKLSNIQKKVDATNEWGTFTGYFAVRQDAFDPDIPLFHQINTISPLFEGHHLFLSLSDVEDLRRAPSGYQTVTVSTHINRMKWNEAINHTELKEAFLSAIKNEIERVFPNFTSSVVMEFGGTLRAWQRYTLRPDGKVGGFPQNKSNALFQSISHRTKLKNFWLVGDQVFPGAGTIGVTTSAIHVYRSITKKDI